MDGKEALAYMRSRKEDGAVAMKVVNCVNNK